MCRSVDVLPTSAAQAVCEAALLGRGRVTTVAETGLKPRLQRGAGSATHSSFDEGSKGCVS
eukprot:365810-Chlamydomonas_euryale.AAC.40